jgi:hypothetical protein
VPSTSVNCEGSKVHLKSPGLPLSPRRGPTTGPPESVQGPVGVGAVATPMALSLGSSVTVVWVTT